jgi:DNA repair exonuclease SbcCD ATPase subunit
VGQTALHSGWIPHRSIHVPAVNTQAEQEQIKALYLSMQNTSKHIDVCFYVPCHPLTLRPNTSLKQAVVKHSQGKHQLLRVSLKQLQETQMYANKLKEVNEYISALAAQLEELKAKCTEETQLKEGKILSPLCLISLSYPSILWTDHDFLCRI